MKVAYIVSMFPAWAETFILNEMLGVKRAGIELVVFPIRRGDMSKVHPGTEEILPNVIYLPFLPSARSIKALLFFLLRSPFHLIRVFLRVLWEMKSDAGSFVKSIILFPQAIGFAKIALEEGVDHIHAHWATHTTTIAYIIWRLTGIPYSFTAHAHDIYATRCMLDTKIRCAKFVVTISEFNKKLLKTLYPQMEETKVHIIHTKRIMMYQRSFPLAELI